MRPEDEIVAAQQPLLAKLRPEMRAEMFKGAYLQRFPAHVELIKEGDAADFLHVMIEGHVEVFARHRDRETTLSVLGPSESFILAAVILDRPYLKSARCLSASRILLLPAGNVRAAFEADADFARCVARELAAAYRNLVKELNNQKLRSGIERLANWLLRHDQMLGGSGHFELPFDKKTLAGQLGLAPEVLSRTFATLGGYGVAIEGRSVNIGDRQALENLARPSPLIDDPAT